MDFQAVSNGNGESSKCVDALPRPEVVPGHVMSWLIKIDISYVGKTWLSN